MPEEIKNKETDTHFEGDSVVGVAKGRHNTFVSKYSEPIFTNKKVRK